MDSLSSFTSEPLVIGKMKDAYKHWLGLHKNIPKTERLSLGQKINESFIVILEFGFIASYSQFNEKILPLEKAITKLDTLKFFIQIAWGNRLISTDKYAELSKQLEEIGRMLGGWRKKVQSKTPAESTGEKQE